NIEITLELTRPGAIRGDASWHSPLPSLHPHQMLVPVLSEDPNAYAPLSRLPAIAPASRHLDPVALDPDPVYRLALPTQPEHQPQLSTHPLTWTTISYVIWDGLSPDLLNVGQQQAMLDWIHWGGQLVIVGGAGPSLAPLQDSFLGPVLPATPSGQN